MMVVNNFQVERRSYELKEFRAFEDNNEKIIEGHAAVFEQKTDIYGCFFEVIDRHAFDGCDLSDVALFINHDFAQIPLARTTSGTLTLTVDEVGLAVRAKLDVDNNQLAQALYSAVLRGDVAGMSFCFRAVDEQWQNLDSDMPTRRILKIAKVLEVSAVTYPAYEGTDIHARAVNTLENAKRVLNNARSHSLDKDSANLLDFYKLKNINLGGF